MILTLNHGSHGYCYQFGKLPPILYCPDWDSPARERQQGNAAMAPVATKVCKEQDLNIVI